MTMSWCRIPLAALAMAATIACSEASSPTGPTPGAWPVRVTLHEHESEAVPQTDLRVTLEEVQLLATSCVPNVPCPAFLAGVTIGVEAAGGPATRTTFYAYDGAHPASLRAVHHGYVVRFVNLTPAITFTPREPYRVDLEIGPDDAGPR